MKVLLIDDSRVVNSIVVSIFEGTEYELKWVENGKIGLDLLLSGAKFDLILLDWNMPVMDGPTFLAEFKKQKTIDLPVIMLTTENTPKHIQKALQLGVSEYIMKPFTGDILTSKIEMVMTNRKAS